MANVITFTFKSDAPWSESELDTLNSELAAVVKEMDDDHVAGSFNVTAVDENDHADTNAKIRDAAIDLIKNGNITVEIGLNDEDDEEILSTGVHSLSLS